MARSLAVVTLGIADLERSKRFYRDGFGWPPVFENEDIVFYQLNGIVLGTWRLAALEDDMGRKVQAGAGGFALAHNVSSRDEVAATIDRLTHAGGTLLRAPDAPPHGGFRGYVADPDDHAWEIAWNPGFAMDEQGNVTFGT